MEPTTSIQETYWPEGICFGCGPANDKGLHIRSFPEDGLVVATWRPAPHHQAFPNILNGGIIGTLLDCHSAATAWWALSRGGEEPGANMVTAEYSIKLLRPTPIERDLRIVGEAVRIEGRRVVVAGRIESAGETTVTSEGTFVRPRSET
ncbi:MAG TPA: PaaI family thioesterase [Actinomycetota bacterium]|nr:PaaI family thioesterase [Actinomycetota bacterium]